MRGYSAGRLTKSAYCLGLSMLAGKAPENQVQPLGCICRYSNSKIWFEFPVLFFEVANDGGH